MIEMCVGQGEARHQRICYDPGESRIHVGGCPLCHAEEEIDELGADLMACEDARGEARWEGRTAGKKYLEGLALAEARSA